MSVNDMEKPSYDVVDAALEAVAGVLLRAFFVGLVIMFFWFGAYVFAYDLTLGIHSKLFGITAEQFSNVNYYGMILFKMLVFGGFLLPYIGIRWTLPGRRKG